VLIRNSARLNGLTGLVITKLDILGGLKSLKICTSYEYKGETILDFPASIKTLEACNPAYETLPGWSEDISDIRKIEDLPRNAKNYLSRIEEITETPINIISVGPGRDETIMVNNPFA
jgi:adenylosuccinate synthase